MATVPVLILPLVDEWIKFTSTTVGRDKMYRLVQYFSKWLAYTLGQRGYPKDEVDRWLRLSSAVGMGRKLFRVGKPIDFMQTILKSASLKDDVIRICAIGRSAFLAGWLTLDSMQWLNANGIVKLNDIKWFNQNAARCWLTGLVFAVAADVYRLRNNVQRLQLLDKAGVKKFDDNQANAVQKERDSLKKEQKKILVELLQDALDVAIPASLLEYVNWGQGTIGLIGTVTSVIGCRNAWPKSG